MFCELISKSLDNLLSVIDFSIDRINYYLHQTKEIFGDNERNENNICFMLIQNSLFENIGLNINSIAYYSDLSISTVRNTIKKLKNNLNVKYTVIETYKQSHTNVYSVNIEALDNYLNDLK